MQKCEPEFLHQFDDISFENVDIEKIYHIDMIFSCKGFKPLMVLCISAHKYDICFIQKYIEEHNNHINEKNSKEFTSLHLLCRNWDIYHKSEEIIKILLKQKNIDINGKMSFCQSPVNILIRRELNNNIFKMFIEHEHFLLNNQDYFGSTVLLEACCCLDRNINAIKLLLSKKDLDLNIVDQDDYTALIHLFLNDDYLLQKNRIEIFELFLTHPNELDHEINKTEDIIMYDPELQNIFGLYGNLPKTTFYKFETEEYFDINFIYLNDNGLKRKWYE